MLEDLEGDLDVLLRDDGQGRLAGELLEEGAIAPVKPLDVVRVDGVLHDLQEVARQLGVRDVAPGVGHDEEVVARQRWRRGLLGVRPEIGEDEPAELLHLVGGGPDPVLEVRIGGLTRLVEALTARVEEPAVVAAAQALLLGAAEGQRGTPVRAPLLQQPETSLRVAEEDEVLAEQAPLDRDPTHHVVRGDGPPVTTEQLTHRRARPHASQQFVLLMAQHAADHRETWQGREGPRSRVTNGPPRSSPPNTPVVTRVGVQHGVTQAAQQLRSNTKECHGHADPRRRVLQ